MPQVGFEPKILAGERPQNYALDCAAPLGPAPEPEYGCKIWYTNTMATICKFTQCNIPKNWNLQKLHFNHLILLDIDWSLVHISTFPQVVYVARNPKDVAVSFYHLNRLIRTQGYAGDFPCYWNYFEKNLRE